MTSSLKPIKLYGHEGTPNPLKVKIFLEELGLPYETVDTDFSQVKQEPFISVNPNGRLPGIDDPNTGVKMFESGAILEYLAEEYDPDHRFTYTTSPERYLQKSWLHFQMSGQGPYFGQFFWFMRYHPEKLESALDRYAKEIKRVLGVVDAHLTTQKTPYLIGDKVTIADLSWIPWNNIVSVVPVPELDFEKDFPKAWEWHQRLVNREAVKKAQPPPSAH